jgi:hypothetical protein
MGMYTEFVFGCSLVENLPEEILRILCDMFKTTGTRKTELGIRLTRIPYQASEYFGVSFPSSSLKYDRFKRSYVVSIRCNLKNYENEIDTFLNWIAPYVYNGSGESNFLGYSIYEEAVMPILYFLDENTHRVVELRAPLKKPWEQTIGRSIYEIH